MPVPDLRSSADDSGPRRLTPPDGFGTGGRFLVALVTVMLAVTLRLVGVPSIVVAIIGVVLWFALRPVLKASADVAPPRFPRRQVAKLANVGPKPPVQIPDLADRCDICGRKLTNPKSMRARVGTDCIKKYGPRYRMKPNPDYDRWSAETARARADQVEQQVRFNHQHRQELATLAPRIQAWEQRRDSDEQFAARVRRRRWQRAMGLAAGTLVWAGLAAAFLIG